METDPSSWNFADVWDGIADLQPEAIALVHGERRITWAELERRADGVARALVGEGAVRHDKVALYLYNDPAYLEAAYACCKAALVPVNTNYRYIDDDLVYLWREVDATAVVFHGAFVERIERIRDAVPLVRTWMWVDDGSGACPTWAIPYEVAAVGEPATVDGAGAEPSRRPSSAPWSRSGSDLVFICTGGTTGMPKAVMWDHDTLVRVLTSMSAVPIADDTTLADYLAAIRSAGPGSALLAACPLMHGTGMLSAFGQLTEAGSVVTLPGRTYDPVAVLDTVDRERVGVLVIVGDAFARPLLDALDRERGRWDLSSLAAIVSAGVMWSEPVKHALLEHQPGMALVDLLGSSEALGMGLSVSTAGAAAGTASFDATEASVVISEDGEVVEPGSGRIGRVGVRGIAPLGYYKDPERSAATFPVIDGVRYALPGDWGIVESDGRITLLGRGSVCINTGGEKVFPEEVEEAVKTHPAVADAVAVGVPDERFGEMVVAVVEPAPGGDPDESDVIRHAAARLAGFKVPRRVVVVANGLDRSPNGKADYRALRTLAQDALAAAVHATAGT